MRIVTVLPAVPRPFGDTAARWFYVLVKSLLGGGHEVSCLVATEESQQVVAESERLFAPASASKFRLQAFPLTPDSHSVVRKIRSLMKPFSETYYAPGLRQALAAELRLGCDVLHLEQLWSGWLAESVPHSLLNIHHFEVIDWEGRQLESFRERKAWVQMRRATRRILRRNSRIRVFTDRLCDKARSINPDARYWVVPFALDPSLYPIQPVPQAPILGLIGSMHWTPSRSAGERLLTRIWPLVKKRVPSAKLLVAGWNARKYLGKYLPLKDVSLEDSVAHPTDFFSRVSAMVYAPSRGSGMKIKVLESMAYGVPVVTTWEGVEGLEYQNGIHCWVHETDEAIAEHAALLLEDPVHRRNLSEAGRTLIEQRYSPRPVMDSMFQVYKQVAATA